MPPKSILIVDDETSVTLPLESFFEQRGYQVFRAFYGDQAIEQLEKNRPQLVILDMQMPGMDGVTVLEKIHAEYPDTKVLVITAYADRYQKELERFHAAEVRTKPISLGEMTGIVEALLEGKAAPKSAAPKGKSPSEVRILCVEGDREMYEQVLTPYFQTAGQKVTYQLAHATTPEEAFLLVGEFQPHLILLNTVRLPIGVESGRLAANLVKASKIPAEVILYNLSASARTSPGETQQQLDRLGETINRLRGSSHASD